MAAAIRSIVFLWAILVLAGCASQRTDSLLIADSSLRMVWPPPPEKPRIKLLRIVTGPEDVIPPSSAMQRFFEYVTGEKRGGTPFVTPAGLVADGEGGIYVVDTFGKGIHKYDLINREVYFFSTAGS